MAERPEVYFKAMVELAQVLHRALGEPNEFDRRRIREEVLGKIAFVGSARGDPWQVRTFRNERSGTEEHPREERAVSAS